MSKMKKKKVFGLLLLASFMLVACGSGGKTTTNESELKGKDSEQLSSNQVFNLVVQQEMPSADLSLATDTISFSALNNVYEGLYRLDKNTKPAAAGAAEMAEISEDGLTYKLKLRKDAKWSNGDPVVAENYVFGWQRTANPKTGGEYAYLFELVKNGAAVVSGDKPVEELGIKAINEYELEITLEKITPYFDYLLAFPSFFPQNKKIVEEMGKDYATSSEKSVYNGPFVLENFDGPGTDTNWTYTKNDQYWDKDTVKLQTINNDVVKEAPTALNLFQDGQADDVMLTGELAQQMANDPELVIEKDGRTVYLEFNQIKEDSPFRNANLRKAISYAIDREAVVNQILGDGSIVSKGLVPQGLASSPEGNKDFTEESKVKLSYNVEKAKEYWDKAKKELGITTFKADIIAADTDSNKKILEYLQGALKENLAGFEMTVSPVPFSVRLDRESRGDFEITLSGWGADYADPSSFLDLFITGNAYNRGKYSNKKYDEVVKSSNTTNAGNPEKRWQDMLSAEDIIIEDIGIAPIYQKSEAHMRNKKVKGVVAHAAGARFDYKWTYISE